MRIALHSSYFGYRGTEVALYDYGRHLGTRTGIETMILLPRSRTTRCPELAQKFRATFAVREYQDWREADEILAQESVDALYCIKNGWDDGVVSRSLPTLVHAIFPEADFHGDAYVYVSAWLSRVMTGGAAGWIPHMVDLPEISGDLRGELGIPAGSVVFGRHGGGDSFDIPWVPAVIRTCLLRRPDIWFLFLGTQAHPELARHPRVRFLPPTVDVTRKRNFLNTCDGMIHARKRGETFGLAVAEFAVLGKPVFTWAGSPERAHLEMLGEGNFLYRDGADLERLLLRFQPGSPASSAYREICRPEFVVEQFLRFLP